MDTTTRRPLLRRPLTWIALGVVGVLLVAGLLVFQPWKLFVDQTVDEAVPTGGPVATAGAGGAASSAPVVLAAGTLISHEHETSGTAQILRLPDGSRVLRVENLDTSNGPALEVWLTDAPVLPGRDGWNVFDDGRYVSLGELKGNKGSANYPLPAELDLSQYSSVSIWCERFSVSFGAATLTPAGS